MNRDVNQTGSPRPPKALVIGLDGGNLRVFQRMAAQGHMPFFASILDRGTSGELRSVFPPATTPAWSTFMTGKNPGKHGVFNFLTYENSSVPLRVVNSTTLKAETLWSLLSRAGKRVGVVNVPMTYPPTPVNGTMITDLLTPSTEQTFTYPDTLYDELRPQLGDYEIAVQWRGYSQNQAAQFVRDVMRCTEQRGKYARHLMQRDPWDLFAVVFSDTDHLQHAIWAYLDPEDDRLDDAEVEKLVCDFFRLLDDTIRNICSDAGEDTRVFFVSDHGFGCNLKLMHINTWLMQQGWLTIQPRKLLAMRTLHALRRIVRRQPILFHAARAALWGLARIRRRSSSKPPRRGPQTILPAIDWQRTKAFCVLTSEQGVRINVRGREPFGTVEPGEEYEALRDEIIARLHELRDPDTGEKVFEAIWKREDVYSGPYADGGADILVLSTTGPTDVFPAREVFKPVDWSRGTGTHRMEGLFAAYGPGIRARATLENAQLQDVVPTLLYSLRQPIPRDVDGRVLSEIYEPEVLDRYQAQFVEPVETGETTRAQGYSDEEEQQVLERLRGLGYIE